MNPNWKDYTDKSVLDLSFGMVSAEVLIFSPATFGIITHPYNAWEFTGTLADAKLAAEAKLRGILEPALAKLNQTA